jgi:hypothetical protein
MRFLLSRASVSLQVDLCKATSYFTSKHQIQGRMDQTINLLRDTGRNHPVQLQVHVGGRSFSRGKLFELYLLRNGNGPFKSKAIPYLSAQEMAKKN